MSTQVLSRTSSTSKQTAATLAERLRKSPLHGIQPLSEEPQMLRLELLDSDPTNPGSHRFSNRYQRRAGPIRDSYDILGRIVYPLVVCSKDDGTGHYWKVDGHGRYDEAKARGQEKIACIVFPLLTAEQRILLRQILNAAQEQMDSPLVLRDLQELAKVRHLDIRNSDADMDALLADLPSIFAKEKKKLKVLAEWPEDLTDRISVDVNHEEEGGESGVIGYVKINQLTTLAKKIRKYHPAIAARYPGEKLLRQLWRLYFDGVFRDGGRSQDSIEQAYKLLLRVDENEPLVGELLKGNTKVGEFLERTQAKVDAKLAAQPQESALVAACNELKVQLLDVYPPDLKAKEKFAIRSTHTALAAAVHELDGADGHH